MEFLCRGRQDGVCNLPYLAVWQVEQHVEHHPRTVALPGDFLTEVRDQVNHAMADEQQTVRQVHDAVQYAKMRGIATDLASAAGGKVLRQGIDWSDSSVDEMHEELNSDIAGTGRVGKAARAILHGDLPHVPAALGHPSGGGSGGAVPAGSSVKLPAWPLAAGQYYGIGGITRGATLARWQAQWNRHARKAADLAADGIYGPATQRAAMTLQRSKGMKVDGLIGRATWTAMFGMG